MDWKLFYNQVYSILVEHGDAHETYREHFVSHALEEEHSLHEWRFCGNLGFGGKIWRDNGRLFVRCYPEDVTPEREAVIETINAKLLALSPPEGVWGPPQKHALHIQRNHAAQEDG